MTRRAWLLFVLMAVLWGVPYLLIKVAVAELSAPMVVFLRTGIAALLLLPVALRRHAFHGLREHLGWLLVLALIEITVPFLLITAGEQHVTSSLAGLLIATEPLFVALLAARLDPAERMDKVRLAGLLVGIIGVAVLLGLDVGGDQLKLLGTGVLLLASLSYAGGAMLIKLRFSAVPSLGVVTMALLISALVVAPAALLAAPSAALLAAPSAMPSQQAMLAVLALAVVCTAVAFVAFFALIAEAGPSRAIVFTYLNPAVAVGLGAALLHEPLTTATVAGFLLIIAGSWLSTRSRRPVALKPGAVSKSPTDGKRIRG